MNVLKFVGEIEQYDDSNVLSEDCLAPVCPPLAGTPTTVGIIFVSSVSVALGVQYWNLRHALAYTRT